MWSTFCCQARRRRDRGDAVPARLRLARHVPLYEVGRYLLELGVVSAGDMTTEACVTKVAYLCGRGLEGDALRDAMETDLRSERSADQGAATDIAHQRASRLDRL